MSGRERCDEVLRMIDEALDERPEPAGPAPMSPELCLANSVHDWAAQRMPDDPRSVEATTMLAVQCFAAGASISEALYEARSFVEFWHRTPGRQGAG
jgi:hypothetical protein